MNTSKKYIVFIATSWGPEYGGINSFNIDLCCALAKISGDFQLVCVVISADQRTIDEVSRENNVLLVSISEMEQRDEDEFSERHAQIILLKLEALEIMDVYWWVGHDVITGWLALELKDLAAAKNRPGRTAIFHHMDSELLEAYKKKGIDGYKKVDKQKEILKNADFVFGVGPELTISARNKGDKGYCIIPGLQAIPPKEPEDIIKAIIFGRLDKKTDIIKKSKLAVQSIAFACKEKRLKAKPRIILIGIEENSEQYHELMKDAENIAGTPVAIIAKPYQKDRNSLYDELSRSSVCLMISLHEGFGLVGWEAIAAEVPLILSKGSGLWKFLEEEFKDETILGVSPVEISGSDNMIHDDLKNVSECFINIHNNIKKSKNDIRYLKERLINKGYTWEKTAKDFLEGLGLKFEMKDSESITAVCHEENPKETHIPNYALSEKKSNPENENKGFPQLVEDLQDARQIYTRLGDDLEVTRELSFNLANLFNQLNSDEVVLNIYKDVENKWHDCRDKFDKSLELMNSNSFKKHEYAFFKKYTEGLLKFREEFDSIFHSPAWNIEDNTEKSTREFVEKLNHQSEAIHQAILYAKGEVDRIILDITGKLEFQMHNFRRSLQWLVK